MSIYLTVKNENCPYYFFLLSFSFFRNTKLERKKKKTPCYFGPILMTFFENIVSASLYMHNNIKDFLCYIK